MLTENELPENKDTQKDEHPIPKMNGKGELDLTHPEAIILDALGLARYQDVAKDKTGVLKRIDLFGGPLNGGAWDAIQEYIASGSRGTLSPREQHYLDLMNLVFSLDGQYGKRNTIRFLVSPYFGFSYEQANNLWSEAVEMFYANRKVSKDAMRAKTADQLDAAYVAAINAAKTSKDYKNAAEILKMKAEVLGLDHDDPVILTPQVYRRPYVVLSLDPASIGLPVQDRRELKSILGEVVKTEDIPSSEQRRLEMEMGLRDYDIMERLEDESQKAD